MFQLEWSKLLPSIALALNMYVNRHFSTCGVSRNDEAAKQSRTHKLHVVPLSISSTSAESRLAGWSSEPIKTYNPRPGASPFWNEKRGPSTNWKNRKPANKKVRMKECFCSRNAKFNWLQVITCWLFGGSIFTGIRWFTIWHDFYTAFRKSNTVIVLKSVHCGNSIFYTFLRPQLAPL